MTRIDCYFNADSKLRAACRLAARAVHQRSRVLIYAPDDAVARDIGDELSTFQGTRPPAPDASLVIARAADAAIHDEVLINLHDAAPRFFSRFQRLVEIVSRGDDDRRAARERFRFYRDRGYEIHYHDIATGGA